MIKLLLMKYAFIFLCIWGICVILLWFRKRIEIFWKLLATFIFIFYVWFSFEEIMTGYNSLVTDWYVLFVDFFKVLVALTYFNLFIFWPLALIIIFYKADDIGAEKLLKFMCILTLVLWVVFIFYIFHSQGINEFLYDNLKKMIPNAK